jgi:hypothetical protein
LVGLTGEAMRPYRLIHLVVRFGKKAGLGANLKASLHT